MAYIGSRPDNVISRNAQNEYNYTATGGQTTFTGADSNNNTLSYTPGNIEVYFNGARLEESDFTATNGTSIVLANAAVVNDELSIVAVNIFEVGSISNFNTSDLAEGSNLYFTNARADARIAAANTDDLSEGSTNLYFTNARADARIASADTDDLSEGSTNLYFTNARVASYLSSNDYDTATNIVASITDSAPSTLDTLNELASALGDDANFSTTVTNSIATKLPLAGGTLTGSLDVNSFQRILANNALFFMNTNNSASSYIKNTLGAGAANLRLGVMGDDKVTILSNGNVGIGTTTPGSQLTVQGTLGDGSSQAYIDGWSIIGNSYQGNTMTKLNWAGGGSRIQGFNSGVQKFEISANSDTYLNGGNVGIGTDDPDSRLHIKAGDSGYTGGIQIEDNDSTTKSAITHVNGTLYISSNTTVDHISILANGNVGIGTSNPQKILHTYGSGAQQLRVESPDSTSELYLLASGTNTSYLSNSNNLQIWTNGGRAITVDASQRVGIGNTSPESKLNIGTPDKGVGNLGMLHTQGVIETQGGSPTSMTTTDGNNGILWRHDGWGVDSTSTGNRFLAYLANSDASLIFANNGFSPKFTIAQNGNIGIGTTAPNSLLHLQKTRGTISGGSSDTGAVLKLHTEAQWATAYGNNPAASTNDYIGSIEFSTGDDSTGEGVRAAIRGTVDSYYNTNSIVFETANANTAEAPIERMRVLHNGNVGINTAEPGAILSVNGPAALANLGGGSTGSSALYVNTQSDHIGEMIQILENGAIRMYMANDGDLALRHSSPDDVLDIQGADNGLTIRSASANRPVISLINGSSTMLKISANGTYGAIGDGSNANRYMSFKGGYVGIGRTDPAAMLDIANNTGSDTPADTMIRFDNARGSDWNVVIKNNNTSYGLDIRETPASGYLIYGRVQGGNNTFIVNGNGNVKNANNSYGSISDLKLKENIIDATSQWEDIKALRIRKYSFKTDELDQPNQLGVIAQELETAGMGGLVNTVQDVDIDVVGKPLLDTYTKDVKYSVLYMKAVKALQEAMNRIETLEAKVTALEEE